MKQRLFNYFRNMVNKQYFEITEDKDKLVFHLKNGIPFFKKYLIIKHHDSRKRIKKEIKNSKVEVYAHEIAEFEEIIAFDIYLLMILKNHEFLKRIRFVLKDGGKVLIDSSNQMIFESYSTSHFNLSFRYVEAYFIVRATELKKDNNRFALKGEIQLINDFSFNGVEILVISKETGHREYIDCDYQCKGNLVEFNSEVYFDITQDDLGEEFDVFLRLKDGDIIIDSQGIKANGLNKFTDVADKYFDYIENFNPTDEYYNDLDVVSLAYADNDCNLIFKPISQNKINKKINNDKKIIEFTNKRDDKLLAFFESFHGKSYSGQPKYIYEKMLELDYDKIFDFVWCYEGDLKIPGDPIMTMRESEHYNYLLRKSNYWITNVSFPLLKNNDEIVYLQTTHGTPYKRMGSDIESNDQSVNKGRVLLESGTWNYLLSPNDYSKEIFKRAFKYEGNVINNGYPANDIFYSDQSSKIEKLKRDLNIPKNKKVILYAPTYRDYDVDSHKNHQFNLLLDFKKIQESLSDEYVLIVRLHYILSKNLNLANEFNDFIIDLSNYDDIADLYLISDLLITDYSSVFFDFAHSKKPILFFVPDFDKYSSIRGLYSEVKKNLPGPELYTNDELIDSIKNIDSIQREYKEKYDVFYNKFCNLGHGDSSEKIVEIVFGDAKNE